MGQCWLSLTTCAYSPRTCEHCSVWQLLLAIALVPYSVLVLSCQHSHAPYAYIGCSSRQAPHGCADGLERHGRICTCGDFDCAGVCDCAL
jgi:hypothetical protein